MPDSFYFRMAETAKRLIDRFGQTVEIKRQTGEIIDPVTGEVTPGTEESFYPNGVLKPYKKSLIDGTRIQKDDLELVLDNTVKPITSDEPKINGEYFTVVNVSSIAPGGTPLIYKVQVRR